MYNYVSMYVYIYICNYMCMSIHMYEQTLNVDKVFMREHAFPHDSMLEPQRS